MAAEIIVTARRRSDHGQGIGWVAFASRANSGASGGGGTGGGTTSVQITSEPQLMEEIGKLGKGDKIILKVEGMPTVVIDGLDRGSFFEQAFQNVVGLLTAVADGRLAQAIPKMSPRTQSLARDLIDDLNRAALDGRFIRFTNVTQVPGQNPNALAGTVPVLKDDTNNLDNDPMTLKYTQIYFNKQLMDRQPPGERGLAYSQNKKADSLAVHIIHELFHVVADQAESDEELREFGTSLDVQNLGHDAAFDRSAMELLRFLKKFNFDLTISNESPAGSVTTGGQGSENINVPLQPGETASVDVGGGNDSVTIPFSDSFVDTGSGDDRLTVGAGEGRIMWFDPQGSDVLAFASAGSLSALAVERFGLFIYIGVKGPGQENLSALELDNVVIFKEGLGPESVEVGGQSYAIDYILSLANSKPDFYFAPEITIQAPFNGGYIADLPGVDPNGDPVTYSVVRVEGIGSGSSWWFEGSALFTAARYNIQDTRFTLVTVRISDGRLYQDYPVPITWTPDPFSEIDPY